MLRQSKPHPENTATASIRAATVKERLAFNSKNVFHSPTRSPRVRGLHAACIGALLAAVSCAQTGSRNGADSSGADSTIREASVKPGINEPYLRDDFKVDEWKDRFERESREIYKYRQTIADAVGLEPGQAVADIGAGTGLFTMMFSETVGSGGRVYAVDIVPGFLEHIADRVRRNRRTNIQTVQCKEDSVELPANSIDAAFICDTYHHFEYPRSSMASLYRALKPGGKLVIIDFERFEDSSREWILDHVRAGKDEVIREIRSDGFDYVTEGLDIAEPMENYFVVFRKPVSE